MIERHNGGVKLKFDSTLAVTGGTSPGNPHGRSSKSEKH